MEVAWMRREPQIQLFEDVCHGGLRVKGRLQPK
jgi:hypothetical protein